MSKDKMEDGLEKALFSDEVASIAKEMEYMFNDVNIEMKTEFTDKEIRLIPKAYLMQEQLKKEYGIDIPIKRLVLIMMKAKVSKKRAGRNEWFDALKAEMVRRSKSVMDRLLGRNM